MHVITRVTFHEVDLKLRVNLHAFVQPFLGLIFGWSLLSGLLASEPAAFLNSGW